MKQWEYRFETATWAFGSILWMLLIFVGIELIFGQTAYIAGWDKQHVLLVAETQAIFVGIMWFSVLPSLTNFIRLVSKGTLDFYLSKPVNIRFLVSTQINNLDNVLRTIVAVGFLISTLTGMKIGLSFINIFGFVTMMVLSIIILYNIFFMTATSVFWFTEIFTLEDLFDNLMDVGKYPVYIFEGGLRLLFIYIIPTAFIATFPVQVLLGQKGLETVLFAVAMAVVTFVLSQKFWNFALKHYSSASS